MTKSKRNVIALVVSALLLVVTLTGCTSDNIPNDSQSAKSIGAYVVDLPEGGTVTCVVFAQGYKGGISCDWGSK